MLDEITKIDNLKLSRADKETMDSIKPVVTANARESEVDKVVDGSNEKVTMSGRRWYCGYCMYSQGL